MLIGIGRRGLGGRFGLDLASGLASRGGFIGQYFRLQAPAVPELNAAKPAME